jgi:N-hydroxyarylamine O-acetyltransferase
MTFRAKDYLRRIGLAVAPPPTAVGLAQLHLAQMRAIPFEASDAFLGREPALDPASIVRKLVDGRRGGWCYELNGLFGLALAAFGFEATPILARVRLRGPDAPRGHLVHLVRIEDVTYLADVGFGGPGFLRPLVNAAGLEQVEENGAFRIDREERTGESLVRRRTADGWVDLFGFDRARVAPADVAQASFAATHGPASPFRAHLMASRHDAHGRLDLRDARVTRRRTGSADETHVVESAEAYAQVLREAFGLDLAPAEIAAVCARLFPQREHTSEQPALFEARAG